MIGLSFGVAYYYYKARATNADPYGKNSAGIEALAQAGKSLEKPDEKKKPN
ncbi:MAG: hypothetical protein ACREGA_03370 [Candidatus Saccharimonadales bacterium]